MKNKDSIYYTITIRKILRTFKSTFHNRLKVNELEMLKTILLKYLSWHVEENEIDEMLKLIRMIETMISNYENKVKKEINLKNIIQENKDYNIHLIAKSPSSVYLSLGEKKIRISDHQKKAAWDGEEIIIKGAQSPRKVYQKAAELIRQYKIDLEYQDEGNEYFRQEDLPQ